MATIGARRYVVLRTYLNRSAIAFSYSVETPSAEKRSRIGFDVSWSDLGIGHLGPHRISYAPSARDTFIYVYLGHKYFAASDFAPSPPLAMSDKTRFSAAECNAPCKKTSVFVTVRLSAGRSLCDLSVL
jgi:hypothetical protein